MHKLLLCGGAMALVAGSAMAESRHDLKLEQAVKDIVASRIGEIRGGLALGQDPLAGVKDPTTTASVWLRIGEVAVPRPLPDGLAPARERPRFVLE
ncbi:MAG: hypothetical protein AB7I52_02805 [Rhizobiaceae bacterium]